MPKFLSFISSIFILNLSNPKFTKNLSYLLGLPGTITFPSPICLI